MQVLHVEVEANLRSLAVFEILGNLHCYNAEQCSPEMRDLFARLLAIELRRCPVSPSGAALIRPSQ